MEKGASAGIASDQADYIPPKFEWSHLDEHEDEAKILLNELPKSTMSGGPTDLEEGMLTGIRKDRTLRPLTVEDRKKANI